MFTGLLLAATPFILNGVMGVAKWLGALDWSTPGKRFGLAVLALVGVFAGNWLNGTPVDPNSISNLVTLALESFGAFVAAHGSYHLFWKKSV